jgi:alkylated DNA nucleotide flippase Atl1
MCDFRQRLDTNHAFSAISSAHNAYSIKQKITSSATSRHQMIDHVCEFDRGARGAKMKNHPNLFPAAHRLESSYRDSFDDPALILDREIRKAILAIPCGKVSTYGGVAAAAGYPRHHRSLARLLRQENRDELPWHRVIGADGALKTSGVYAKEQKSRLRMEGVKFRGDRVDLDLFLFKYNVAKRNDAFDES